MNVDSLCYVFAAKVFNYCPYLLVIYQHFVFIYAVLKH